MTEQDKYFAEPNRPTIIYIGASGARAKYYPIGELVSFNIDHSRRQGKGERKRNKQNRWR